MEQALVVLAVWAVWSLLQFFFEASPWVWVVIPLILGVGGQALIDHDKLWLGLGIGGAAILVMRLHDLMLVVTDWVRVAVLRTQRR
jgi:hypothetical protein